MRVLVTGGRKWASVRIIRDALTLIDAQPGPHTLVHGAAKGADSIAAHVATELGWKVEAHPADWTAPCTPHCRHRKGRGQHPKGSYCPSAGAFRNGQMVAAGADLVLAFFAPGQPNTGTNDCVKRARKAGLEVQEFRP